MFERAKSFHPYQDNAEKAGRNGHLFCFSCRIVAKMAGNTNYVAIREKSDVTWELKSSISVLIEGCVVIPEKSEVTQILREWNQGDPEAPARLMPLVYEELRRRAADCLRRERGGHTLQATALVHEAYVRLVDQTQLNWKDRAHFYGIA